MKRISTIIVIVLLPLVLAAGGKDLKVMSFNVRCLTAKDKGINNWEERKDACIAMLKSQKPDVVGFQEPRWQQRDYFREKCPGYCFLTLPDSIFEVSGHTMMAYSRKRFILEDNGYFWLSTTPDQPSRADWGGEDINYRTCLWARLKDRKTGKTVLFFTSHLPYRRGDNYPRTEAMKLCIEKMKEVSASCPDAPIFFVGDMNASSDAADERKGCFKVLDAYMEAARFSAPKSDLTGTFTNWGKYTDDDPTRQIDHIYSRNCRIKSFSVDKKPYKKVQYISDHYPIFVIADYMKN